MKSDIEIAHEAALQNIQNIASSIGIDAEQIEQYGKYKAKVNFTIDDAKVAKGNLILVFSIDPAFNKKNAHGYS
jgi:formate--tetrahydrofolate ligase